MRSYFKSLVDGVEYTLDILDGTSDEVVLSGAEPVVTTWDNNGNLFAPARYSGATINIVTNEFLWRLYASSPQEIKVKLRQGNTILWVGYVTPTMYNQNYVREFETMQIDCVDGLSTLRYIKYTPITKYIANKHPNHVWSLWELMVHCISKADCYSHIYVSDSISLYDVRNNSEYWQYIEDEDILKSLYVSESLFWDTENKEYMTCDKVLEAICSYLSLTMIAFGDAVYFVNYLSVAIDDFDGRYYHHYYNIDASQLTADRGEVVLRDVRNIIGDSHKGASNISLDSVYSKVFVKPLISKVEKLFVDYDNDDTRAILPLDVTEETVDIDIQVLDLANPSGGRYWGLLQMFSCENWQVFNYPRGWQPGDPPVKINHPDKYIQLGQSVGTTLVREMVAERKSGLARDIQSLSFNNYILMRCQDEWYGDYTKPYIEASLDDKSHAVLAAGEEGYLIISGSVLLSNLDDVYFIPANFTPRGSVKEISLMARLQMWDHYYNGSVWTTEECDFEIPLKIDGGQMFGNWFDIANTVTWLAYREELNANGCGIPLPFTRQDPESPTSTGIKNVSAASYNVNAKLTLYPPKRPESLSGSDKLEAVFIKDLKCDIYTRSRYDKSDVVYTKVNNSSYVEELQEDDMLINTYDKRNQSFSFVSALARATATSSTERRLVREVYDVSADMHGAPEQLRVDKLAKQYSTPKVIFECVLNNNITPYSMFKSPNMGYKTFVVDTQSVDWLYSRSNVKLIECNYSAATNK